MARIRTQFIYFASGLIAILFIGSTVAWAQRTIAVAPSKRTAIDMLPDKLGDAPATTRASQLDESGLNGILGDRSELAKEYGLASAATRAYKAGESKVQITIFQFEQPSRAFGFYRIWSDGQQIVADYPPRGEITNAGLLFWQGRYLVQIIDGSATATDAAQSSRKQYAEAVSDKIGGVQGEEPGIMAHLPGGNLVPGSPRYLVGPVGISQFTKYPDASQIDFSGKTEVATADYNVNSDKGELMIIEFQTPQFATQGLDRMQKYLDTLPAEQRNRIFLKREGNYAVQTLGFNDRATAQALADKVKYTYTIKWITKPPNSPFDMSDYRKDALKLLVAIFALIGGSVLIAVVGGILVGRLLFMRRRAQLQDVFSDAGGMIRLNLDDMVSPSLAENPGKLLGKGD